jgi:hypothetical protein
MGKQARRSRLNFYNFMIIKFLFQKEAGKQGKPASKEKTSVLVLTRSFMVMN